MALVMTICGIDVLLQMLLYKMYHMNPGRKAPEWLISAAKYLSCACACRKSSEVTPDGEGGKGEDDMNAVSIDDGKNKANAADETSDMLKEIRVLSKKVKCDEEDGAMLDEWKAIADGLDKFFFILFMILQVVMALICFGIVPFVG